MTLLEDWKSISKTMSGSLHHTSDLITLKGTIPNERRGVFINSYHIQYLTEVCTVSQIYLDSLIYSYFKRFCFLDSNL